MQRRTVLLIRSDECGWADVRRALDAHPTISVVGEAMSARQAVDVAGAVKPDVIISAEKIGGVSTLPLLAAVRTRAAPGSRIVLIAGRFDPADLDGFADIGMTGHLLWSDLSTETLSRVLTTLIQGNIVMASREVADAFLARQRGARSTNGSPVSLTVREQAVLRPFSQGLTHQQIADEERISRRTVERLVASLESKLDVANHFLLGYKTCQLGLVDDADWRDDATTVAQSRQNYGAISRRQRAGASVE